MKLKQVARGCWDLVSIFAVKASDKSSCWLQTYLFLSFWALNWNRSEAYLLRWEITFFQVAFDDSTKNLALIKAWNFKNYVWPEIFQRKANFVQPVLRRKTFSSKWKRDEWEAKNQSSGTSPATRNRFWIRKGKSFIQFWSCVCLGFGSNRMASKLWENILNSLLFLPHA